MLHAYASSVIIYALIIWAEIKVFTMAGKDNGWMDAKTARAILNGKNTTFKSFILALIPVFRLLFVIGYVIVGLCKKETIDDV